MRKSGLVLAVLASIAIAAPASAATYNFNFSGPALFGSRTIAGSGVFTTSNAATTVAGQTAYSIVSITGTADGSAINAPNTGASYGNYFTTGPAFLDGTGLRFFTNAGEDVRFFFQDPPTALYRVNTFGNGGGFTGFVTATSSPLAAVPEPAIWGSMLLGFGLIGAALRRRRLAKPAYATA